MRVTRRGRRVRSVRAASFAVTKADKMDQSLKMAAAHLISAVRPSRATGGEPSPANHRLFKEAYKHVVAAQAAIRKVR